MPNDAAEERRTVTALFADLSGFTSLAARLDAEELLLVVDPVLSGLAEIVHRFDGYVEKFAGDALLALFGAPVSHEDDPIRALQAAVEMHALVTSLGVSANDLTLHVGVNTGPVVARSLAATGQTQYAALGEPVILAQRLQAAAAAGETLVGEGTARLTASRFNFDDLGSRPVKGLAHPLPMYRLTGGRTISGGPDRTKIIGRDEELAEVLRGLTPGVPVLVTGPAGSGKSRLLTEVRQRLGEIGTFCVEIAAASYSEDAYRCFGPLIDAALVACYPNATSTQDRLQRVQEDLVDGDGGFSTAILLGQFVPEKSVRREPLAVRRDLHQTAGRWLRELARRHPVAVLVDNEQWLDTSSTDLLRHLIAHSADVPVTFCIAGRSMGRPWGDQPIVTVPLGPLDVSDVEALISDELQLTPDRRFVDLVHGRAGGNPLMTRETVRQLRAAQLLDIRPGRAHLILGATATPLPTNLEALLATRLDTLSGRQTEVAKAAAGIGVQIPVGLLTDVMGKADVAEAVQELVDLDFLRRSGEDTVRFDSALLREVCYARMTTRQRRALHARIARALLDAGATTGSDYTMLAEHRYLAGELEQALPMLRECARRARAVFAPDEAIVALGRALEAGQAVAPETVPELLCDLADLRMELGEYDRAADLFARSRTAGNDARAWAGEAATQRRRGDYGQGWKSLQDGFAAEPVGDVRLLWCELSWNLSVSGDLKGSLDAARRGLELDHDRDDVAGLLLLQVVRAETLLGELTSARRHIDEAIENLEAAENLRGLCSALRLLGSLHERQGDMASAAVSLERGLALAERTGLVEEIGGCLVNLGLVRGALQDHLAAADCYARAEGVFAEVGHRAGQAVSTGNRAYELFMLGDVDGGRTMGERALALALDVGNHYTIADIHHTLGLIAEAANRFSDAYEQARAAIGEFELAGMPDYGQPSADLAERVRLRAG